MASESGEVWTIVVAAGTGSRFRRTTPKQFVEIAGRRVLDWSAAVAAEVSDGVVVVLPPDAIHADAAPTEIRRVEIRAVLGGASRTASVRAGLAAVPDAATIVLVHDAARPNASVDLFASVIEAVRNGAVAVVPVMPVVDSIREVDGTPVDRDKLRVVQTPQGFDASVLRRAYESAIDATDDATVVSATGEQITMIEGERWNLKLTEPADEVVLAALLIEGH